MPKKSSLMFVVFTTLITLLVLLYLIQDKETTLLNEQERHALNVDYINLSHGAVHYELKGAKEAPTVIMVHGFSIPSYIWEPTYRYLIEQGYRVLRFDLYGRGFSARPDINYDLDDYVEQLDELTQGLDINMPFHLVGLSMGGAISTRYASRFPDKIKSLSLLAPLVETPDAATLSVLKIPLLGEYLATVVMMPKLESNLDHTVFDPSTYPEWQIKLSEHIHYRGYRHALLKTLRYLAGQSFTSDYQRVGKLSHFPVELIWGKQDPVIAFDYSEQVMRAIPRAQMHSLEQTGHLPQIEQAKQVNDILLKHFKKTDQTRP